MELTIAQLAQRIGAELVGDGLAKVSAVGTIGAAGESNVTFVSDDKHIAALENSRAAAVIVGRRIDGLAVAQLIVKNVNTALIEVLTIFAPESELIPEGIASTATLGRNVKIAEGVSIGPSAVINDGVQIGENTVIAGGCKIGQNSKLGKNCRIDSNVVIYHDCMVGNNVIIQANSTIGSTGFGYYFIDSSHKLIPHNGGVVVEDFVEIGANCCIDRAKFGNTVIGAGTKMDNLVHIAHNVVIGRCCLLAGQTGIAGSSKLGNGVVLAGQSGITDNIEISDGVIIGGRSGVLSDVAAGRKIFGTPATDYAEEMKLVALRRRLPKMNEQLKQLSKRVERLESAEDNKE